MFAFNILYISIKIFAATDRELQAMLVPLWHSFVEMPMGYLFPTHMEALLSIIIQKMCHKTYCYITLLD